MTSLIVQSRNWGSLHLYISCSSVVSDLSIMLLTSVVVGEVSLISLSWLAVQLLIANEGL